MLIVFHNPGIFNEEVFNEFKTRHVLLGLTHCQLILFDVRKDVLELIQSNIAESEILLCDHAKSFSQER